MTRNAVGRDDDLSTGVRIGVHRDVRNLSEVPVEVLLEGWLGKNNAGAATASALEAKPQRRYRRRIRRRIGNTSEVESPAGLEFYALVFVQKEAGTTDCGHE